MKNILLIIITLGANVLIFQSCDNAKNRNNPGFPLTEIPQDDSIDFSPTMDSSLVQVMNTMLKNMAEMKMTGDFDIDFANMLLVHHHGVVDMTQIEISTGADEKVKTIAQSIRDKQKKEIKELQEFLNHHKPVKETSDDPNEEILTSIKNLRAKIKSIQWSGQTDKDFVLLMISHHECAMDLATQEVLTGHHVKLKLMSQNLIADQKKEIAELRKWLAAH